MQIQNKREALLWSIPGKTHRGICSSYVTCLKCCHTILCEISGQCLFKKLYGELIWALDFLIIFY